MNKSMAGGIEVEMGSGNVFADFALPDADKLRIKSGLVIQIIRAMRRLHLTQNTAPQQLAPPQPKVSAMLRRDFPTSSECMLMECLNRLSYDIEIKPTTASVAPSSWHWPEWAIN